MEIDEGIVTLVRSSISKASRLPILDAVDYSAVSGDGNVNTLHYTSADFSVEAGSTKAAVHRPSLLSPHSGLMASGSEGAPKQESSTKHHTT